MKQHKVIITWGGWDGHQPEACSHVIADVLRNHNCSVEITSSLDFLENLDTVMEYDLVIINHTMSTLSGSATQNLGLAVRAGVGLGGWHGGLGDAFRGNVDFQFLVGGQFLCHPGNIKDYQVDIVSSDPIVAGLGNFQMRSEQYYMMVDPRNEVLAQTVFSGDPEPDVKGVVMPTVWKKTLGKGRIFYSALGHNPEDLKVLQVLELTRRGLLWACR
jgi:uncharacterized protein